MYYKCRTMNDMNKGVMTLKIGLAYYIYAVIPLVKGKGFNSIFQFNGSRF